MSDSRSGAVSILPAMLRSWCAAREAGENPLPHLQAKSRQFVASPEFGAACDSLFALTECVLGRRLEPACCCSPRLSADEEALLALLYHGGQAGMPSTGSAIPHGLPGALRWAVIAVNRAAGDLTPRAPPERSPNRCPFGPLPIDRAA